LLTAVDNAEEALISLKSNHVLDELGVVGLQNFWVKVIGDSVQELGHGLVSLFLLL
jgi:hypothetical protein